MFNFPTPSFVGQKYQPAAGMPVYGWDGAKWTTFTPDLASKVAASNTNPVMDGTASAGSASAYARGDHVHPTDSTRGPINNMTFTGTLTAAVLQTTNITISGKFSSTAKGHRLGYAGGTAASGAVQPADANLLMYQVDATNWCGWGSDPSGHVWLRTGYSGSPAPVLYVQNDQVVVFRDSPTIPTPGASNDTRVANTAYVKGRVPSGMFPLDCSQTITGGVVVNADLWVHNNGNYGVLYLGNTGSRYLIWDGSNYSLAGAHAYASNGRLYGTGDWASAPYNNARLALLNDYTHTASSGMAEPVAAGTITGQDGWGTGWIRRYRQFQYYTTSWFAIGYA